MILGASHITLAATDLGPDLAALARLGYEAKFVEENIPSHRSKEFFLSKPYSAHCLALAGAAKGLPIELVIYDSVLPDSKGCMIPVFDQVIPEQAERIAGLDNNQGLAAQFIIGTTLVLAVLPRFGTPAYFSSDAHSNGGLVAVEIAVGDIVAARSFWEHGLGYHFVGEADDRVRLEFRSPINKWQFTVFLRHETPSDNMIFLDSSGFACLSMICTDLSKDRSGILSLKGLTESTGAFDATVNGQHCSFELFKGPGGVYVELLQVKADN